ncbi:polymerase 2 ADP-ribosyltransferase 2 [Magnaporthiopsis poae ATCC 64411]|uniref:Poly [ADP-ribose] polymerase n=1 Tax=Magnaporthiopsis poae (strain ATCC 64411 / 73-15) TaxID=644358 RepID=A0A0C4EB36_MAGP6|nr:polymerase 2 ADP-ribosyltransferase 2 [Magnaporthiopsis poae ATCC 64411]
MPPRRSARTAAAAAAAPPTQPLDGLVIALSGTFDCSQADAKAKVVGLGATVSASVTKSTTHLVTTEHDFLRNTTKVKAAAANDLPIVSFDWLVDCEANGKREPEKAYDVGKSAIAAQAAAHSQSQSQKSQNGVRTARGKGKSAASSAAASAAASEAEEDDEEVKPKPKTKGKAAKGKAATKSAAASTAASAAASEAEEEEDEEAKPKPKPKGKAAKGKAAAKSAASAADSEAEEEEEEEEKPKPKGKAAKGKAAAKPAASTTASAAASDNEDKKAKPKARAKAGAKRASTAAVASDEDEEAKPKAKRAKKGAKAASNGASNGADADSVDDAKLDAAPAKGKAPAKSAAKVKKEEKVEKVPAADGQTARSKNLQVPLDEACTMNGYAVYIDDNGHIWDASLNQTNASNNNNKFYRVQIIRNGAGDFKTWTRWGRVGELGQKAILGNGSEQDAIKHFEKKFKDKSGHSWEDRLAPPKVGKYTFVERSYNEDSDDEDEVMADDDDDEEGKEKWVPPTCSLSEPVQNLMKLIFNQQYFAAAMSELNYDANKLPLGKLSKSTISRGFQALKDLSVLLDDPSRAQDLYGMNGDAAIEHLSNSYYSVIPHAFGRARPPVICEESLLKKEVELLESLSDMKDANNIMGKDKEAARDPVHPLTKLYNGLNLEEMTALENSSDEFKLIKDYLNETRGATHGHNYTVKDIFRIERAGEHERFDKESPLAGPPQDRRLLWHGSRVTNFGGILSQGLRIAPPEAPVSGYMFGKGIYLADMSSKSANYCCSYISGGEALLLLCEAELGKPMQELTDADYHAGDNARMKGMYSTWGKGQTGPKQWRDAGAVHASLAGTTMPDTSVKPGATKIPGAYLQYNEFIVYDVSQVRLRYLLRVKM